MVSDSAWQKIIDDFKQRLIDTININNSDIALKSWCDLLMSIHNRLRDILNQYSDEESLNTFFILINSQNDSDCFVKLTKKILEFIALVLPLHKDPLFALYQLAEMLLDIPNTNDQVQVIDVQIYIIDRLIESEAN
jgi:hypothetical protein